MTIECTVFRSIKHDDWRWVPENQLRISQLCRSWSHQRKVCWPLVLFWLHTFEVGFLLIADCEVSSSWWQTPSRALPYWRLDAKHPFPLPSSKPCGPQSSERPHLSLSARWILVDQEVSANEVVVATRRRWHGYGPPLELIKPGARKTSIGATWPFQRLASSPWCSWLCHL